MNEVEFGSKKLPRLLCGSSPFMGAGQFGPRGWEWYKRFFQYPDKMAEIFGYFCRLGFPGIHVIAYPSIIEAARLTQEQYSVKIAISLLPDNWITNLDDVSKLEPETIFIHGSMTDSFLRKRMDELLTCLQAIRDRGAFPGLATHNPHQTLTALQDRSNPLSQQSLGLLLPINASGWGLDAPIHSFKEVLQNTGNQYPVMAMKVLAAGRLPPKEALEFVFGINQIKAVTIGIVSKEEADEIKSVIQIMQ